MKYYAIRCRFCPRWSAKQVPDNKLIQEVRHKCVYCRKSFAMKKKNEYGIQTAWHGPFSAIIISKVVAELNSK